MLGFLIKLILFEIKDAFWQGGPFAVAFFIVVVLIVIALVLLQIVKEGPRKPSSQDRDDEPD